MKKLLFNFTKLSRKAVSPSQPIKIKKFYKQSTFTLNSNPQSPLHKFVIKLDDKFVYTPYRNILAVPTVSLAQMITRQFNLQKDYLKSNQMPMLSLCRTAVDADIQGNVRQHLLHTIFGFLKTDTLNFYESQYEQQYNQLSMPIIKKFSSHFGIQIKPSSDFEPPMIQNSKKFEEWITKLNNWQLIGLQTMTVWLQSIIAAYYAIQQTQIEKAIQAANIEEMIQIQRSGETEEKRKILRHVKDMVESGYRMYKNGNLSYA